MYVLWRRRNVATLYCGPILRTIMLVCMAPLLSRQLNGSHQQTVAYVILLLMANNGVLWRGSNVWLFLCDWYRGVSRYCGQRSGLGKEGAISNDLYMAWRRMKENAWCGSYVANQ